MNRATVISVPGMVRITPDAQERLGGKPPQVRAAPISGVEWLDAVRMAPGIKDNFFTVLSLRDCLPEVTAYSTKTQS